MKRKWTIQAANLTTQKRKGPMNTHSRLVQKHYTVISVFETLERLTTPPKYGRPSQLIWIFAVTWVVLAIAGVVADWVGYPVTAYMMGVLFALAPLGFLSFGILRQLPRYWLIMRNPVRWAIRNAASRAELIERAGRELRQIPPDVRATAYRALAAEREDSEARVTLIVGVMEKTGLVSISGVLYLIYVQAVKAAPDSDTGYIILSFGVVFYALGAWLFAVRGKIREKLWLLEQIDTPFGR